MKSKKLPIYSFTDGATFWLYVAGVIIIRGAYNFRVARAGGLSQAEIDMVNTTNHLNFSIEGVAVTNLPFHLLQLLFFRTVRRQLINN